ncbi:MAG: hypothetical protein J0H42_25655 [Rhizobiales bacterium]|nr:hypothetical protein [Hyphomicrobiales bacterium]
MPVAIALIIGVVVLAVALVGLVWAVIVLLPFYAYVAIVVYLIWRSNRKHADLAASVKREADLQRHFNEQEMRAWRRSLEEDKSRTASRRERILRRFDEARDPPKK